MFFNSTSKSSLQIVDNSCQCSILNIVNFGDDTCIAETSPILHLIVGQHYNFCSCRRSSFDSFDAGHRILGEGKKTCSTPMHKGQRSGNFDCNFFTPDSLWHGIFRRRGESSKMVVIQTLTNGNVHQFKFNIVKRWRCTVSHQVSSF